MAFYWHLIQVWWLIAQAGLVWHAVPHCVRIYDMDPSLPLPSGATWEGFYGSPAYTCTAKLGRHDYYFCAGPNC